MVTFRVPFIPYLLMTQNYDVTYRYRPTYLILTYLLSLAPAVALSLVEIRSPSAEEVKAKSHSLISAMSIATYLDKS